MSTVRVVFVSAHVLAGGAERYLASLLESLGQAWVERVVFLAEGPMADETRARGHRVEVLQTSRGVGSILRTAWRLRRMLAGADAEVVHADGVKAALVSVLAAPGIGIPVLWVKHDFSWDGPLTRLIAARCAEVIGVSETVLRALAGTPRTKTRVIYNGVAPRRADRAAARQDLAAALGGEPGSVVGLVGRLHPAKGQRELLAVTRELGERLPQVQVVLVGGEDPSQRTYAAELRRSVAEQGVSERVVFLGHREDAASLVAGFDVAVVPSVPDERGMGLEGFGFAAVEAMAAGTPVVAYADGALPEILGDCGLLVAPGDRTALRDAVVAVLEDGALRDRLARCGRERARERFPLSRSVEAMIERYRALGGKSVSAYGGDVDRD
jgi:glycosyltransferase involved in cell wall biosynthesis